MSSWIFFGSYAASWALLIALGLVVVGLLRQVGLLQQELQQVRGAHLVAQDLPEEDGPTLGTPLPSRDFVVVDRAEPISLTALASGRDLLLAFLSPLCEGCHTVADPLERLVRERSDRYQCVVVLWGDTSRVRAFRRVFPISAPIIPDFDGTVGQQVFMVHRNPGMLLYDAGGKLYRKATGEGGVMEELATLLAADGGESAEKARESDPLTTVAHVR